MLISYLTVKKLWNFTCLSLGLGALSLLPTHHLHKKQGINHHCVELIKKLIKKPQQLCQKWVAGSETVNQEEEGAKRLGFMSALSQVE